MQYCINLFWWEKVWSACDHIVHLNRDVYRILAREISALLARRVDTITAMVVLFCSSKLGPTQVATFLIFQRIPWPLVTWAVTTIAENGIEWTPFWFATIECWIDVRDGFNWHAQNISKFSCWRNTTKHALSVTSFGMGRPSWMLRRLHRQY